MLRCLYSFLLCIVGVSAHSQQVVSAKDLQSEWTVWDGSGYIPYVERQRTDVIHFVAPPNGNVFDSLVIACPSPCSVYVNHHLVAPAITDIRLPVDSLLRQFASPALISIYQEGGIDRLKTELITIARQPADQVDLKPRAQMPLYDFSILATMGLMVFFVALLYSNLHHTLDYLNVLKLFAIQEREDNVLNSRVSASANIVFYMFTSLLGGLVLLIIFNHAPDELRLSKWFLVQSAGEAVLKSLALSAIMMALLLAKFVLIVLMSSLFNWRDHLPIHFFNFIRLVFLALVTTGACCLFLFIVHEQDGDAYAKLLWIIVIFLILWGLLVSLKLMARIRPRFFHLFSYLCASEFIPLVITIKILLS